MSVTAFVSERGVEIRYRPEATWIVAPSVAREIAVAMFGAAVAQVAYGASALALPF